jgi:hypothetical protein
VDDLSALPAAPNELDELPATRDISKASPLLEDDSADPNSSSAPKIAAEKAATPSNPTEGPKSPTEDKPNADTSDENQQCRTLPEGWEERIAPSGRKYYIDHKNKTTS